MTEQPGYLAYLLRLWRVNDEEGPVWRASVESPHTGERHGFANLELLFAFLEEKTEDVTRREEPPGNIEGLDASTGFGLNAMERVKRQ